LSARILDGKATASALRGELRARIGSLLERGIVPALSLIRVGEDPASVVYVRNKAKACADLGIRSEVVVLADGSDAASIARAIDARVADPAVHGILLQLPLPGGIDPLPLIERIAPEKDVDGFHPLSIGRLNLGLPGFVPCTPLGIFELLRRNDVPIEGRHVAVVGRSTTVGRPLANLLSTKAAGCDASVTMLHTGSTEPWRLTREADIVIAAAGRRGLVDARWVRPGATVIDVGIHRGEDGRLCGDVDAPAILLIAGAMSPVPGGVGPMTVACLMANTVLAAENQSGMPS
jgi:methylenetetrahydrofolate dehydrogenase (NADP+)/methenyltetrahydrofolate cyclohydrolase